MKKIAGLFITLSLVSLNGFAAVKDSCAAPVRAAAAAKVRASSDFRHWDPSGSEKAQIRGITMYIDDEGGYQVTVEYGLPQEDSGETGSADFNVGVEIETDGSCHVVSIQ